MKKIFLSTVVSLVILFFWSGLTQIFPWGVPTTQAIHAQESDKTESFQTPNLVKMPAKSLTTNQFDKQFSNKISTYTTDETFSWIISKPISYYNPTHYFIKEILVQFIVSIFMAILLFLTQTIETNKRLLLVLSVGVMCVMATYGQMMNWWGMPALYGLGVGLNLVIGWLIASWVSIKYILKSK
jgi:hypothetical protein